MTEAASVPAPADQKRRIALLRLAVLLCVPVIAFSRPGASVPPLALEAIESLGMLMVVAGVLGRFWSILYIGGRKNAEVMRTGPYSVCRHPLYLSSTIAVAGFGLMLGSLLVTTILTGAVALILADVAAREERHLGGAFGRAYADYAAEVPRILPAPRLFRTPDRVSFEVRTLRRNLADALVFLALVPLGEFLEYFRDAGAWPTIPLP